MTIHLHDNQDFLNEVKKTNFAATTDPTVDADETLEFSIGSRWINTTTNKTFTCVDARELFAVWEQETNDYTQDGFLSRTSVTFNELGITLDKLSPNTDFSYIANKIKYTTANSIAGNYSGIPPTSPWFGSAFFRLMDDYTLTDIIDVYSPSIPVAYLYWDDAAGGSPINIIRTRKTHGQITNYLSGQEFGGQHSGIKFSSGLDLTTNITNSGAPAALPLTKVTSGNFNDIDMILKCVNTRSESVSDTYVDIQ